MRDPEGVVMGSVIYPAGIQNTTLAVTADLFQGKKNLDFIGERLVSSLEALPEILSTNASPDSPTQ
jgi:hypothetical protein